MTLLPITHDDFESLVERVTKTWNLPFNDDMRVMTISFLHGLERSVHSFEEADLGSFLWKATSNDMTFHIGQEIHKKRQAEAKAKAEQNAEEIAKTALSVVP